MKTRVRAIVGFLLVTGLAAISAAKGWGQSENKPIDLPTSKQILPPVPGGPQRVNSLPISMAVSPDQRYIVMVNAGYGTFESRYMQSLAVLDTKTGKVEDFPESWTLVGARQTLYSGLAFSGDGSHVYASLGSETDPLGDGVAKMGSGIIVYGFRDGKITREKMMKIPMQQLASGRKTLLVGGVEGDKGVPFPAAIAVLREPGAEKLLIAGNLSDDVLLMDAATGAIEKRFDLSETDAVPSTYPVALAVTKDQSRAFVALWNASEVVELDLKKGIVGRKLALLKPMLATAAGTHPVVMEIAPDERTMYVALANRDAVAAVNLEKGQFAVKGYFDTRLPGQSYFGAEPDALAVSQNGRRVYVGNAASDAVAVLDATKLTSKTAKKGMVEPLGFVPTEWMPTAMTMLHGRLYVATAKGKGTGPNNFPQRITPEMKARFRRSKFTYIPTLIYGSVATLDADEMERELPRMTAAVLESNRMKAAEEKIAFSPEVMRKIGQGGGETDSSTLPLRGSGRNDTAEGMGSETADPSTSLRSAQDDTAQGKAGGQDASKKADWSGPIKHVIYIIKENRTYDQVFGDLEQNGKRVGNGDASLTMYGKDITPNQHALALQFGVLDNFYDSGEVSGDGHVWSTAAIGTDYLERTWEQDYRGSQRTYDFEGVVAEGYPLLQNIPDVNEPSSGYLWGNLARHGKTYYHFGEYISSTFCDVKKSGSSQEGPLLEGLQCEKASIKPGEAVPPMWGGGVNKWPWAIPLLAKNIATKPELVGHFAGWKKDHEAGKDTMPNFIIVRMGNDHTAGTTPGGPTPRSSVADNDLAIGRVVDAVSHSAYWDDTALFILEDDAQNGADHVDAHRSDALVISKYAPRRADGSAFVDSRFYSTVSVIRTMETLLGLPPMNNNDAFSSMISPLFTGPGDQKPFTANYMNRDNGLIYTANPKAGPGAKESAKMDFRHADRADPVKLNVILWMDAMGDKPVPAMLLEKRKSAKKDDDDDD